MAIDYRGLAAPVSKSGGGYFASAYLEELIWSSIWLILFTPLGSLPGKRDFGTNIVDFIFEQVNLPMLAELQNQIGEAISKYEPRVIVDDILVAQREHEVRIRISLRIVRSLKRTERILLYDTLGNVSIYY